MKTIHYGQSQFHTADAIATMVLVYAEALAIRHRFAVVDIPTVTASGIVPVHLLIGPGIPLAAAAMEDGPTPELAGLRDEFGGNAHAAGSGIGELEVRRTVKTLTDGLHRVRDRIWATPLDDGSLVDDVAGFE